MQLSSLLQPQCLFTPHSCMCSLLPLSALHCCASLLLRCLRCCAVCAQTCSFCPPTVSSAGYSRFVHIGACNASCCFCSDQRRSLHPTHSLYCLSLSQPLSHSSLPPSCPPLAMGILWSYCCRKTHVRLDEDANLVRFSPVKGPGIHASNWGVSGNGTCLANAVLIQTRAYWEVTLLESGDWWIGVARKSMEALDRPLGERPFSWGLSSSQGSTANQSAFKAGDVISVSHDLSGIRAVLLFRLNGAPIDLKIDDVKGDVYPAVSVANGAGEGS